MGERRKPGQFDQASGQYTAQISFAMIGRAQRLDAEKTFARHGLATHRANGISSHTLLVTGTQSQFEAFERDYGPRWNDQTRVRAALSFFDQHRLAHIPRDVAAETARIKSPRCPWCHSRAINIRTGNDAFPIGECSNQACPAPTAYWQRCWTEQENLAHYGPARPQ